MKLVKFVIIVVCVIAVFRALGLEFLLDIVSRIPLK